ncbi:PAS domain S-box protein [Myxosarcina sp. GI1(2024)]
MQQLRRSPNLPTLAEVWESNPLIFKSQSLLSEVVGAMNVARQSYALVIEGEELAGIFTESDLVGLVAREINFAATTIGEVMTGQVITLASSQCQDIFTVWSLFEQHDLRYLPVIGDRQEVLGVITLERLLSTVSPTDLDCSTSLDRPEKPPEILENTEDVRDLLENGVVGLHWVGEDGRILWANQAELNLLGYSREEYIGHHIAEFHVDAEVIADILRRLIDKETLYNYEARLRCKDGSIRYILISSNLLWKNGQFVHTRCFTQDITECKRAESELEGFFAVTPTLFCLAGLDGYFKRLNPIFNQTLGFTERELLAEPFINFVHPEDRAATLAEFEKIKQDQTITAFENRYLTKEGSYCWLLWTAKLYREEKIIYAAAQDISDRQQAELLLQQERDFSTAVLDTVGSLVAVIDRQGRIIRFNRTCERVTGYTFSEVKGRRVWELLVLPSEQQIFQAVFQRLLAGQLRDRYEAYWLAKDGSTHLISWSDTALFDSQGTIEFIIATGIEITEQRQIQNRLEHQYRQTQLLAEITRKIRMSIELDKILQTTVTEVRQLLACDRVLIVKLSSHHTAVTISESVLPELPSMLGYELADPLLVGKYSARYHQGKTLAISDVSTAALAPEIEQLWQQFEIKAKLVVPILSPNHLQGLLVAHQCHSGRQWQSSEIELLQQLADQIGVALSQAQLLNNLEELVEERTNELITTNQLLQAEIAERQQTEIALRENQQKLAGILDNADEAIISIDERQYIQLFNQGAEKVFGYRADEVVGKSLDILMPEAFRQIHRQHVREFGNSVKTTRIMSERDNNVRGRRKNGEEFSAEASISKLQTRDGLLFTVILKDITERQQAAAKLLASETLLAKAENIAKIGSWQYDLANEELTWSQELFRILGFAPTQAIPDWEQIFNLIHPNDRFLVKKAFWQAYREGKSWQFNYRLLSTDGSIKYLESRGEPTVNSQGKMLKVWGTIVDITERKRAEISLHRSKEQLQLITDSLPVLISYVDCQQRYRYNNRTYETWFNKSRQEMLGLHMSEVIGNKYYQQALPYIKQALSGKSVSFEMELTDEWGNHRWVNATYITDCSCGRKVEGFFAMIEDITERKTIEQMKSEFVSVTSHEMRTPLTSIYGVLKLLCAERLGKLTSGGEEMAQIALKNTDRLIRLVNDVLDLEKLQLGRETLEKQWCNSFELIQQAVDTLATMAQQHQITIETDARAIELEVDRDRIVQTLSNLLSNAIKFSAANSKVWVSCQQRNDEVLFAVRDRGRGIPSDKLDTIFERFQQVDASDSRNKDGTGLGLAICRHIVEQHGGKIWVESVFGRGSTFFFTLPQQ